MDGRSDGGGKGTIEDLWSGGETGAAFESFGSVGLRMDLCFGKTSFNFFQFFFTFVFF